MEHSKLLRRYRVELMETIDLEFCPLMDHLESRGVVTPAVKQRIEANYKANIDQVGQLINYLSRRPYEDYLVFRDALCQTNQKHIVDRFLPQDGQISTAQAQQPQERSPSSATAAPAPVSVIAADEMDTIRHDLAALSIKQSQGPHKPEDDEIDVTFTHSRLQIKSKDTSQPIKPLLSTTKLRGVLDSIVSVQVETIRTHLVNLDLGFNELFTFTYKCKRCKRLIIDNKRDNSDSNAGIIKGLQLALRGLGNLLRLDIRDTYLGEGGRQVLSSLSCPHLRVLTLMRDQLAGCGPQLAACLTRLPLLAYLNLTTSGLTGEEMSGVLDNLAVSCPQLVVLQLGGNLSRAADALTRAVQATSRLQVLDIARCELDSNHLLNIVKSTSLKIEYLKIWGNAMCTEVERELVRLTEQRPSLRYVAIKKVQVSLPVWDRMESVLRGRGGHLHEQVTGSDEIKKDNTYLNKVLAECLIQEK